MVPYSLTNYYIEQKFEPTKATLGDINGVAYLLGGCSTVFAGPLSRKIGLINTMGQCSRMCSAEHTLIAN